MAVEMGHDLALGFGEKSEIDSIAQQTRCRPDRKRSCIPQGVEQALASTEILEAALGPGEVLRLLARCLFEGRPGIRVARSERLALVERLRADFSGVIYPHQRCRVAALSCRQLVLRQVFPGHRALRARRSEYRAQAPVEGDDQLIESWQPFIEHGKGLFGHHPRALCD